MTENEYNLFDGGQRIPTILIVEDEAIIRMAISDHLQKCGFNVLEAVTAEEAVVLIQTARNTIDLVFSDIRLPGKLDGFGLSRWVRKNHPDLVVILASGDAKKSHLADELCAEQELLSKPYDMDAVVMQIRGSMATRKNTSKPQL